MPARPRKSARKPKNRPKRKASSSSIKKTYVKSPPPAADANLTQLLQDLAGLETRNRDLQTAVESKDGTVKRLESELYRLQDELQMEKQLRESLGEIGQKSLMVTRFSQQVMSLDFDHVIKISVAKIPHIIGARHAAYYAYVPSTKTLHHKEHSYPAAPRDLLPLDEPGMEPLLELLTQKKCHVVHSPDDYAATMRRLFDKMPAGCEESQGMILAPIWIGDEILGLFLFGDKQDAELFDDKVDVPLVEQLSVMVAAALQNFQLYKTVQDQARTDGLTGLYNHATFYELLTREVKRAQRYQMSLSLLIVDLDNFKRINDSYGHAFGNIVIRQVADILRHGTRNVDICCRYGGDEFAVICPQTPREGAFILGGRLAAATHSARVPYEGRTVQFSCSIGLAVYQQGMEVDAFFKSADRGLYKAKAGGKNQVQETVE